MPAAVELDHRPRSARPTTRESLALSIAIMAVIGSLLLVVAGDAETESRAIGLQDKPSTGTCDSISAFPEMDTHSPRAPSVVEDAPKAGETAVETPLVDDEFEPKNTVNPELHWMRGRRYFLRDAIARAEAAFESDDPKVASKFQSLAVTSIAVILDWQRRHIETNSPLSDGPRRNRSPADPPMRFAVNTRSYAFDFGEFPAYDRLCEPEIRKNPPRKDEIADEIEVIRAWAAEALHLLR